jgi:hypothetical protein
MPYLQGFSLEVVDLAVSYPLWSIVKWLSIFATNFFLLAASTLIQLPNHQRLGGLVCRTDKHIPQKSECRLQENSEFALLPGL